MRYPHGHGIELVLGADLRFANLERANFKGVGLRDVNFSDVNLRDADLRGAYLVGADFTGAYLKDANFAGTYIGGANLIHCGVRSDGHEFYAHTRGGELWVLAGCRYFRVSDARKHWTATRSGTPLGDETFALLDNAERLATIRGLIDKAEAAE